MSSVRDLTLDIGDGNPTRVRLGDELSVRGLKRTDGVIYPRHTGVHLEDNTFPKVITAGGSSPASEAGEDIFSVGTEAAESFVSSDIQRISPNETVLPYAGPYRLRLQLVVGPKASTNVVFVLIRYSLGGVITALQYAYNRFVGDELIQIERIVVCDRILSVRSFALSSNPVMFLRNRSGNPADAAESYFEVEYLGAQA